MSHTIGGIAFIDFSDPTGALKRRMTELETRAGVAGHSIWINGERGEPTKIRAVVDVADVAAGIAKMQEIYDLIGTAVEIVWANFEFPNLFDVQRVDPLVQGDANGVQVIALGVGGTQGTSGAFVACELTIIETDEEVPAPEPDP